MTFCKAQSSAKRAVGFTLYFLVAAVLAGGPRARWQAHGQGGNPVTTVSAASFEPGPLAPEAIVAAFGAALATHVEIAATQPLPTTLANTTVRVKDSAGVERLAPLFFVAPTQINYLIPANTAPGAATITVTSGAGVVSTGAAQIAQVAPALFTANASGQGVPAAVALRVKADGAQVTEAVARLERPETGFVPAPLDLGPAGEQVFLILFGTGMRGQSGAAPLIAKIGGVDAEVLYAGPTPGFAGLDQVNLRLPRSLVGRGRVNLAVASNGFSTSNVVELEIAAPAASAPPMITSFGPTPAMAGQTIVINGFGFSANPAELLVRIAGNECRITAAAASQISCQVPFGARTGPISLRTPQGESASANPLQVRTSISGVIENTNRQPLSGVKVSLVDATPPSSTTTNAEGAFILPDVAPSNAREIEIDGASLSANLLFPKLRLKLRVSRDQDNPLGRPVSLQQITGTAIPVGGNLLAAETTVSLPLTLAGAEPLEANQIGAVSLEIPSGATVRFPDGATSGNLTLTQVRDSRTPVNLPSGIFSSVIVQLAPFGATLTPGAKLVFPNLDNLLAGSKPRLFKLDQTAGSATLGAFIDSGEATVSADGQRIETAPGAIKETSYYFVANVQPVTTVAGRVVDADGRTPVRLAVVRVRGQETFTDGNGGFVLRNIPVKPANDRLTVEASFVRPSGRVDRTQCRGVERLQCEAIAPVVNGVTPVTPDLVLPGETSNRPPVIIAPTNLAIRAGVTSDFNFVVSDPDPGQTLQVTVSGASFASVSKGSNESYTLRLAPTGAHSGQFTLALSATDNQGATTSQNLALSISATTITCGQTLTGNISQVGQQDTYSFSANAGESVYISAHTSSGSLLTRAEVYSPTGVRLGTNNYNDATGSLVLAATGTYTILVKDYNLRQLGTYNLNLQFTTGRCATSIACGQTLNGGISGAAQVEAYIFSGNQGQVVNISAVAASSNLLARAEVYGPTGVFLDTNNYNNATGTLTLPSTGAYTILVRDYYLERSGAYNVNLQFTTGRCGKSIACGQTLSGTLSGVAQQDAYTFSATAGEVIYLSAVTASGNLLTRAEVYSPTGVLLRTNNYNDTTGPLALPTTGTYTILLRDYNLNRSGAYNVNLQFASGRCATSIACGQTVSENVSGVARVDAYAFSATAGEAVYISAHATSGSLLARAEVYSPTGVRLSTNNYNDATGSLVLTAAGTYIILVRDYGLNRTGFYNLNLQFATGRCGAQIAPGQTLSGSLDRAAKIDTYTFYGRDGGTVNISAIATSSTLLARAEIYGPAGTIIGNNRYNGPTGSLTLRGSGTYTILIRDYNLTRTGGYNVNLACIGNSCTPP